jgi:hypothetical protein
MAGEGERSRHMRTPKRETTEIELGGLKLDVSFYFHPSSPGYRDKEGAQIDPDEPEFYEVEDIRLPGTSISLAGLIEELNGFDTIEAELHKKHESFYDYPETERENENE